MRSSAQNRYELDGFGSQTGDTVRPPMIIWTESGRAIRLAHTYFWSPRSRPYSKFGLIDMAHTHTLVCSVWSMPIFWYDSEKKSSVNLFGEVILRKSALIISVQTIYLDLPVLWKEISELRNDNFCKHFRTIVKKVKKPVLKLRLAFPAPGTFARVLQELHAYISRPF